MGYYVNVVAKPNCSNQINALWREQFDGFLIYNRETIMSEIAFIKKENQMPHLQPYLNSVKDWNKFFPNHSSGKGQVFLRAYGYSDEELEDFEKENTHLKEQIKFLLQNRFLFSKITGLDDANDVFPDLNIKGQYMENGKLKMYEELSFKKLPVKKDNRVYQHCLEIDRPDIWKAYNDILEQGLNFKTWSNIRHLTVKTYSFDTVWKRCELIYSNSNKVDFSLKGYFNNVNQRTPTLADIKNAILLNSYDFEALLKNKSKNQAEIIPFKHIVNF